MSIFNLPDLGEGLPDAEIHKWHVKKGDKIKTDEPLVSMETAKAVVDVPSPCDGEVEQFFGDAGDIIKTGSPLVKFKSESTQEQSATVVGEIPTSNETLDESISFSQESVNKSNIKATPAVRAMAKKLGVDLSLVDPSGKNGIITLADVQNFAGDENSKNLIPLKGVRRVMAQAMEKSHAEIVPVTITEDAIFSPDFNFSDVTTQIICALIEAIKTEPNLNSWYYSKSMSLRTFKDINLGIAMDTQDGLFVPVIEKVQNMSNSDIRATVNTYKKELQDRTIKQESLKDLTITLSNFGSLAGKYASPIITPPSVAILGIGKMREIATPINNKVEICKMLPVSLTFDHRAITGGESARFIGAFISALTKNQE